jgi:hypothetical protein
VGLASRRNRPVPRIDLLTADARARVFPYALVVLRAALAIALAAAVTALITAQLPRALDVRTDVVGYPIHSNFNANRYLWMYALWAVFFPVLAVAIDHALARLGRGRVPRAAWPTLQRAEESKARASWSTPATGTVRVAFVGAVLGVGAALFAGTDGGAFLALTLSALVLYAGVAFVAAAYAEGLRGGRLTFWERLAAVNLVAAPLTVFTLFALSEATEVRVLTNGRVFEYRWFPLWLAAAVTTAVLVVLLRAARRARTGDEVGELERRSVLLVAAPVLLFVVVARLPDEIGVIDFFHEGELLAATHLTAKGAVPWRDLIFVHGMLHDVIGPLIGFAGFENTRWGYFAGVAMILGPLYFISQYFLFVYLFGRNVLFLLGTQLAVVLGVAADVHFRFVLMPVALLLLAAVLRTPSWWRAAALGAVLLVQAVLTPEAAVAIPAVLVVLAVFELTSYRRGNPFLPAFSRTVRTAASGAVGLVLLFVVFAALRILDDFLFFYRTFLADHVLTGGIPLHWWSTRFRVSALAPVVAVILAIWFFATALRARRRPVLDDWVMAALAITVLLYYPKFLARTDPSHLYQVFPVAVPLLAYAAYRLLSLLEGRRLRFGGASIPLLPAVSAAAVAALAVAAPLRISDRAEGLPKRASAQAHLDPFAPRLSFLSPWAIDVEMIIDVKEVLDTHLAPGEHVFDFSNNPLLFHYLLERRPSTRYFHVSMAMRQHTQADLIERLEQRRPALVVFSSNLVFGLPVWDQVPNHVRHYDVSEYVLDHYRPLLSVHDFLFMARNDSRLELQPGLASRLKRPPVTDGLYFRAFPCDWGYAPNFLTTGPAEADRARAVDVVARPTAGVVVATGWAVDREATAPAIMVVAAAGRRVLAHVAPSGERAGIAGDLGDERFTRSGFRMSIEGPVPIEGLRFYALTRDGRARELVYGEDSGLDPMSPAPRRLVVDGRAYEVVAGGVHGSVDTFAPEKRTWELVLPQGSIPAEYDWVEIEVDSPIAHDLIGITDVRGDASRTISFRTLDRGHESIRVQVGACTQWHGFENRLYLESAAGQEFRRVRLVP